MTEQKPTEPADDFEEVDLSDEDLAADPQIVLPEGEFPAPPPIEESEPPIPAVEGATEESSPRLPGIKKKIGTGGKSSTGRRFRHGEQMAKQSEEQTAKSNKRRKLAQILLPLLALAVAAIAFFTWEKQAVANMPRYGLLLILVGILECFLTGTKKGKISGMYLTMLSIVGLIAAGFFVKNEQSGEVHWVHMYKSMFGELKEKKKGDTAEEPRVNPDPEGKEIDEMFVAAQARTRNVGIWLAKEPETLWRKKDELNLEEVRGVMRGIREHFAELTRILQEELAPVKADVESENPKSFVTSEQYSEFYATIFQVIEQNLGEQSAQWEQLAANLAAGTKPKETPREEPKETVKEAPIEEPKETPKEEAAPIVLPAAKKLPEIWHAFPVGSWARYQVSGTLRGVAMSGFWDYTLKQKAEYEAVLELKDTTGTWPVSWPTMQRGPQVLRVEEVEVGGVPYKCQVQQFRLHNETVTAHVIDEGEFVGRVAVKMVNEFTDGKKALKKGYKLTTLYLQKVKVAGEEMDCIALTMELYHPGKKNWVEEHIWNDTVPGRIVKTVKKVGKDVFMRQLIAFGRDAASKPAHPSDHPQPKELSAGELIASARKETEAAMPKFVKVVQAMANLSEDKEERKALLNKVDEIDAHLLKALEQYEAAQKSANVDKPIEQIKGLRKKLEGYTQTIKSGL